MSAPSLSLSPPDEVPKRVILASTEPDAVCAGLLLARESKLPVRRVHAPEFALGAALAHPVCLRLNRGELVLVGFAPLDGGVERLIEYMKERPGLGLDLVDHHVWPKAHLERVTARCGNRAPMIDPENWTSTETLLRSNGGDPVARRIAGLVSGGGVDQPWSRRWRRAILGAWSAPGALARVTEPLLRDPADEPDEVSHATGKEQDRQLNELAGSTYHVFPVGDEVGVLVLHPSHAAAPVRELAARVRVSREATVSLSAFDGGSDCLLEWGRRPFGFPPETDFNVSARSLATGFRALLPSGLTAKPLDRGTIRITIDDGSIVDRLTSVLAACADIAFP